MIRQYIGPVAQGVGIFILAVMVLAIPYLIWQYRRQGTIKPRRALVHATFALYLICAWALVLLPLPDPSSLRHPAPINLVPFHWWTDMMTALATSGGGWRAVLTNGPLLIRLFNVALTVPLGVYLRRWFRRGLLSTTIAGFGLSLAFELTQLTALWGLYPMSYRSFDVDDLIANTAGAALGWAMAPAVVLLPRRRYEDDLRVVGAPTPLRRLLALAVDLFSWALVYLVALVTAASLIPDVDDHPTRLAVSLWTLTFVLVFIVVPVLAAGATPGRALLGVSVQTLDGRRTPWWRYLIRELVLLWPVSVAPMVSGWVHDNITNTPGVTLLSALGIPLGWLLLVGVVALSRRDRRSLPDLAGGTRVIVGEAQSADH